MEIKLNSIRRLPGGYHPPSLRQELLGPKDLADYVLHGRQFSRTSIHRGDLSWEAPLTDDGARQLINLVFYASLMPEEGRFLRFKVVCQDSSHGSVFMVSRIDPVAFNKVDPIRRLAPACTNPDCALLVVERNGEFFCEGVINVGGMGYGIVPGLPGVVGVGTQPAFRIEVLGPAHIRVIPEGIGLSYEIRAGRIRPLSPYDVRIETNRLWNTIHERIQRDVIPVIGEQFAMKVNDLRPFLLVLSRILGRAVEARHGGSFIFLPSLSTSGQDFGLTIQYPTHDLDLGDDIIKQWIAFGDVAKNHGKPEIEGAIRQHEVRRSKTLTDSEAVANFSAVDGCVVLTHDLRVLGFGAKIGVSSEESQRSTRRFKHIASNTTYQDEEFMRFIGGTRHQSVARLCQTHEGVLAYTVSQDGEVKLFFSDSEFAYVHGPLDLPTIDSEISVM